MAEITFRDLDAARDALDRVVEVQRKIEALTAARAELLVAFEREFDAAYPPGQAMFRERARRTELACALRIPERTAERLLGEAGMLTRVLPATLIALRGGQISYRHAQVMIDETATLEPRDRAELEGEAVALAERLTVAKFRGRLRILRERRHPESMAERCRTAFMDRSVSVDPGRDGMAFLTAHIGAVEAEAIFARLSETARLEIAAGDPRTLEQLRADLLVDVLIDRDSTLGLSPSLMAELGMDPDELRARQEAAIGRFAGIRPTVVMTVPMLTLLGVGNEPAMVEGVGPIDPVTARQLTAEAPSLYRMLTDPATGVPLAATPESYRIGEPLRVWLRIRDGSCTFPGCGIRTGNSDIDHTHSWGDGGRSLDGNLAHLSRGHHTLKHHGGWTLSQPRPGYLVWTSFLGRRYEVEPQFAAAPPSG